jgi:hypothetical protein
MNHGDHFYNQGHIRALKLGGLYRVDASEAVIGLAYVVVAVAVGHDD